MPTPPYFMHLNTWDPVRDKPKANPNPEQWGFGNPQPCPTSSLIPPVSLVWMTYGQ